MSLRNYTNMGFWVATAAGLAFALSAGPASAHTAADDATGGFFSGFTHPLLGWDHVTAMVAVGLWGTFLRAPAIWVLPVVFPVVMAFGGALGVLGVPIPAVETGIAVSSIVLGLLVAFAVRLPLAVAGLLVGIFAIFHGHAHGTELPGAANPVSFAMGFVLSTGLLHLLGIGFGLVAALPRGAIAVRLMGGLIALAGFGFLLGLLQLMLYSDLGTISVAVKTGELLCVTTAGILIGQQNPSAFPSACLSFIIASALGLILALCLSSVVPPEAPMLAVTVMAGLLAALARPYPRAVAWAAAAAAGLALGASLKPAGATPLGISIVAASSVLGASLWLFFIAGATNWACARAGKPWLGIGTRVVASWAIAISAMMLALVFRPS